MQFRAYGRNFMVTNVQTGVASMFTTWVESDRGVMPTENREDYFHLPPAFILQYSYGERYGCPASDQGRSHI